MDKLTRGDLYSLEQYAEVRSAFRAQVMEHKKNRRVPLGPIAALYFEDRLTMHYQIQEMLRAERIFEPQGVQEELDAYNPLIPDGSNWKATFMIEYEDPEIRAAQLAKLIGIEDLVWVQVEGFDKVWCISNEDLERSTANKTSSVHFLHFRFSPEQIAAFRTAGTRVVLGFGHENYGHMVALTPAQKEALAADFD